jgi:3-hydroxyacyl-CoA dehydrogenase/enoyl-CoA hydratase/3-hydroxybutyryl-CoA epimerase
MPVFESATVTVDRDAADGSFVLLIDVPGKPVNVINPQLLADLGAALTALEAQPRVPVVAVRSGKKAGFLAGADLNEFLKIGDVAAARATSAAGQDVFARLARLKAPTVCVLHGATLGGGLELALACDYRLVFDKPGTQLGLPEVRLGLLPAWGGTQRLPRVVGLEQALKMILAPKMLNAREAFECGLADAYASDEASLREQFAKLLVRAVGEGKRQRDRLPIRTWRQRFLESNPIGRRILLRGAERQLRNKVPDDMPAPLEAFDAVRVGVQQGMDAGFEHEREAAARLGTSKACRNLVSLFFQSEAARKAGGPPLTFKKVGVVGAGVMGAGIAQLAALSGFEVVVQEVNDSALQAGKARIDGLFATAADKGRISRAEMEQRRAAVRYTTAWEGFADVGLVVEAALEDAQVKRNVFRELDERTPGTAVLATNTSSLTVSPLAEGLRHPQRVAGLHFFNPVHKMPLVEVVRAAGTPDDVVETARRFAIALGKTPVVVGDRPGFVVNRVLMPYLNEGLLLVGEGLAVQQIDRVMRRFGLPMGPLELLDQIGLDVAAHVGKIVREQLGEKYAPHPGFELMRQKGWLGLKSGTGFYVHKGEKPSVHKEAQELIRATGSPPAAKLPEAARLSEARERMVLLMVNESAQVLSEGVADAATIDLAMIFGTEWAPHRGGPLRYADDRGLTDVVQALEGMAARLGPRFAPCEELKRRAAEGRKFRE